MTSKPDWPRIWELFEQALEQPAGQRAAWVEQQCQGDADLLREIEGLLAAHETDTGVLDRSVQPLAAEALNEPGEITSGESIGPYRILSELGRGGMGVVYKAEDTRLERTVALKFLAPHLVADPEIRARFTREAKAAATLNHPNICTVYEIEEIQGRTFISMAYIDGQGLDELIARGPLKLAEALDIAAQAGEGLAEAHSQGIVHRDVKPGNIMIRSKERSGTQAIIMDFGLARLVRRSTLTRIGTRVGTVIYMSPEQTEGSKVDHRSDVWALGVVLYEMICGLSPFRGEYDEAVLYSILNEDPEPLTGVRSGLPVELDWIVSKALAKLPQERYQSVEEFVTDLRRLSQRIESGRHKGLTPRSLSPLPVGAAAKAKPAVSRVAAWGLALAATAVVSAGIAWWAAGRSIPAAVAVSDLQLTRITRDAGLATTPALSPDGALVAFASDRAGDGNLDIWLQQTTMGGAVQLTNGEADEYEPAFSPDGSRIVFRSEADGGAIHAIPVLGGEARLIARNGRRPVFSPDGTQIAFYIAAPGTFEASKMFVVSANGGAPRPLQPQMEAAAMPLWAPDGRHIVFWGRPTGDDLDLWVTSLDESTLIKLNAVAPLRRQNLRLTSLDAWAPGADRLIFSGIREHSVNLWQLPVSTSDWKLAGPAERLTFGADEREASAGGRGRYAFTSASRRVNVWTLPLQADGAAPAGPPERLTTGETADIGVDIVPDGTKLVFRSNRGGSTDLWLMDVPGGTPRELTATPDFESMPRISSDGSKVAFSVIESGRRLLSVVNAAGGSPELVCDDCGSPLGWSLDGTKLLYLRIGLQPAAVFEFDTVSREDRPLIEHSEIPVYVCHLSSDGQWLVFKGDLGTLRTQVYAAPVPAGGPVPPESWIPITAGNAWDDLPRWSSDGRMVYFLSDRDGFRCIWARRFNPASRQAEGEVFPIQHFHRIRLSLSNLSLSEFELDTAPGRLVFPLAEISGNIWMINPASRTATQAEP
jgi:Tol biopolymer transport system component/predicted Ser/Thr protein kinase